MKTALILLGLFLVFSAVGGLLYGRIVQYGNAKKLSDTDPRLPRLFAEFGATISLAGIILALGFIALGAADNID